MTDVIDSSFESLDVGNLLPSFFQWIFENALTKENGGIFGIGLLLLVAMVSFLTFKGFRYEKAMMVSSMLTWMIAFFILKAGWINNFVFTLACIYVAVGLYYLFKESSAEEA